MKNARNWRPRSLPIQKSIYYDVRFLIPRPVQVYLRRQMIRWSRKRNASRWPIDAEAGNPPQGWQGWPGSKRFALVLTHDVETQRGAQRCHQLMEMERSLGFRSAYYFVAARYGNPEEYFQELQENNFEVGVHGLFHDGKLFSSRSIFKRRAVLINRYLAKWKAVGFRAPAMHHVLEWIRSLDILYDASTFDVDPFEPQADGCRTVFPYLVWSKHNSRSFVELPYTLPQDFTVFVLMKQKTLDTWKRKIDWIAEKGAMALVITHPDYMSFGDRRPAFDEYPAGYYEEFLRYIKESYHGQYWHALPREIASYWLQTDHRAQRPACRQEAECGS